MIELRTVLRHRPVLSIALFIGVVLVAFMLWAARDIRDSAHGCIDQEAGRQQAEDTAADREKTTAPGSRPIGFEDEREAERQKKRNGDAERRCGQTGVPFELALRDFEMSATYLGVVATIAFGFCTLCSVLIVVAIRDDDDRRASVQVDADSDGTPDRAVRFDDPVQEFSLFSAELAVPRGHAPPPQPSDADRSDDLPAVHQAFAGPVVRRIASSAAGSFVLGLSLGIAIPVLTRRLLRLARHQPGDQS